MDINAMGIYNSAYSQAVDSTSKYDDVTAKDYTNATDEELMEACKEFESYFVEQMFKAMQKMVPESDSESSTTKMMREYYMDELTSEYASSATESGDGVGIAQMLFEQMKRNYDL